MTDHFEDLWERSESVAEFFYDQKNFETYHVIAELQEDLILLRKYDKNQNVIEFKNMIGKILFDLTYISKKHNVNTYSVLKDIVDDIKIEMLDEQLDKDR